MCVTHDKDGKWAAAVASLRSETLSNKKTDMGR